MSFTPSLLNVVNLLWLRTQTIIPIEDLYAANAEYKDSHGKALAIIQSSSAVVSTISSSILIWKILRSPQRLSTTRHRILFGVGIGDIIFSLSFANYNTMIPSDVDYISWNAQGNQATCNMLGFLTVLGAPMSLFYSCSLNIYFLAMVKYNKTDHYIRTKMEPFLHGIPIGISPMFAAALLATQGFNSDLGNGCISPVYDPPHCIGIEDGEVREGFEIPCGRGRGGPSTIIFSVGFFFLFVCSPTTVGVTIGMMHRHVSRQERRMGRYGEGAINQSALQENTNTTTATSAEGSNGIGSTVTSIVTAVRRTLRISSRSNHNQNGSMSRVIMVRARAYSIAYALTYSWLIAMNVLEIVGVSPPPMALQYLSVIFGPLQGLWNLMIFMYPKVMDAKRSRGGNRSWCEAIAEAFFPAINRWRERRTAKNDERIIPQEEEENPEIPASQQQQGDTTLVTASISHDGRPGIEEEKIEIEASQ